MQDHEHLARLVFGPNPPTPPAVPPPPDGPEAALDRPLLQLIGERLLDLQPEDEARAHPGGGGGIGLGTLPPWYAGKGGLDAVRAYARSAADALEAAGDQEAGEKIRTAIAPKRERGRPPEWQPADVLFLWMDVMDVARRNPAMRGRTIFAVVGKRPEWEGLDAEDLRSKFREGASKLGMSQTEAIAALRGLGE
jgi:hypothetical protein